MISNNEQTIFDNIMFTVLTTVSSENYLKHYNIHRPKAISNWESFKKKIKTQNIKPGIYPRSYGNDTAHFHAVRKEKNGSFTIANGYPTVAGLDKNYSIGLNVQKNHSHGLCQVYALMYYHNDDHLLFSGEKNYYNNIIIGLNWLYKFTIENDWIFTKKDIENIVGHEYKKFLHFDNNIYLSSLILIILKNSYSAFLKNWFK